VPIVFNLAFEWLHTSKCPECGQTIEVGDTFCRSCGTPLDGQRDRGVSQPQRKPEQQLQAGQSHHPSPGGHGHREQGGQKDNGSTRVRTSERRQTQGSTEATGHDGKVNKRIKPVIYKKNLFDNVEEWNNIWLARVFGVGWLIACYLIITSTPPLSIYVLASSGIVVLVAVFLVSFWIAATIDVIVYE